MLNRSIGIEEKSPHPDIGVKGSIGNNIVLNEDWDVGFLVGGSYDSQWRETTAISRNFQFPAERIDTENESTRSVNISGNLNLGLQFTEDHSLSTTSLYLRNTDDETAIRDFFNENRELPDGLGFRNYRQTFEERALVVNQINGTHILGSATRERLPGALASLIAWVPNDASVKWFYSDARARTDIPNEVNVASQTVTDPLTGAVLSDAVTLDATAANYRFTDLDDEVENSGLSVTYPMSGDKTQTILSFGYEYNRKLRSYKQSQFSLGALSVADTGTLQGPLDEVFSDANVLDPANNYVFDIQGTNNQSYIAATMTDAVFGNVDWTWDETWRVSAGARWEDYRQVALDWNPFGYSQSNPQVTTDVDELRNGVFQEDKIYPALSVTYMTDWLAETFQLRLGLSQTAVRPDLREITDASYLDPRTDDLVDGNPGVRPAEVNNVDLRAEWFFSNGDNLTATLFYKDITDPIEFFESAASDTTTAREIINAESAEVYGLEFEGLKELGFLGGFWSDFFVRGNVTIQDSELVAGPEADAPTNPVRKVTGASDYVANLSLGYDSPDGKHTASLGYNVFGERLYVAGRNGAPDGFEQPFHSVDVVYSWYPTDRMTFKAKLQNILGEKIRIEREGVTTFEEDPGSTFAVSFQWAAF
jgi:TonB-dependent receptor